MNEKILKELKSIHRTLKSNADWSDRTTLAVILLATFQLLLAGFLFVISLFEGDKVFVSVMVLLMISLMFILFFHAFKRLK